MSYEEMLIENFADIKNQLRVISEKLDANIIEFNKLQVIVKGNGSQGHEQRIETLEAWKKTRPEECPAKPLSKLERWKIRSSEAAVMGLLIAALNFLISWLPKMLRG